MYNNNSHNNSINNNNSNNTPWKCIASAFRRFPYFANIGYFSEVQRGGPTRHILHKWVQFGFHLKSPNDHHQFQLEFHPGWDHYKALVNLTKDRVWTVHWITTKDVTRPRGPELVRERILEKCTLYSRGKIISKRQNCNLFASTEVTTSATTTTTTTTFVSCQTLKSSAGSVWSTYWHPGVECKSLFILKL